MRLVSYNIQYGVGKDGRNDLKRIAGEIAGADVIALQEVERFWTRSGNVDQPAELARLLPEYHWAYGPGLDIDAIRIVSEGATKLRSPDRAMLVITHYQRLLNYIVPDKVHVLAKGRIQKTGGKELALELEKSGYAGFTGKAA